MASARRSLGAALEMTPEKLAFIQSSSQPAAVAEATSPVATNVAQPEEAQPVQTPTLRDGPPERPVHRTPRTREKTVEFAISDEALLGTANLLVPLTTRLQPRTAAALKRAGLEQKLRGQKPSSVQEIVEIAIQRWLVAAKYLD